MTGQMIVEGLSSHQNVGAKKPTERTNQPCLLIIDKGPEITRVLHNVMEGCTIETITDRSSVPSRISDLAPQVVILELDPSPSSGDPTESFSTLTDILEDAPDTKVIIISGSKDRQNAVKAIGLGAYDFHEKPIEADILNLMVHRAFKLSDLEAKNHRLSKHTNDSFHGIVTDSPKIHAIFRTVEQIASAKSNILIIGESGTRKEMYAQALHNASNRSSHPFIPINCGALSGELLAYELFGYAEGAFHGAIQRVAGKMELANGGTLFLDDIDALPISLQRKLLAILETKILQPEGSDEQISVDVRLICATRSSTLKLVKSGAVQQALITRISENVLDIPPLRDRDDDSYILAQYYIDAFSDENGMQRMSLSPDAQAAIRKHPWPGNVRELENKIKRAMVLAEGAQITADDLCLQGGGKTHNTLLTLRNAREAAERKAVRDAVDMADGNLSQAAKLLDVSRPTVYNLIKTLGIKIS